MVAHAEQLFVAVLANYVWELQKSYFLSKERQNSPLLLNKVITEETHFLSVNLSAGHQKTRGEKRYFLV